MDLPASFATPVLYRPNTSARPRVDRAEMLRYLGYGGQEIDLDLERRIVRCVEELELSIEPKGVRRTFRVDASGTDDDGTPCIQLVDSEIVLTGRDIYRHLKDATFCTVLACTLGMDCERKLRTLASQQALDAALFDAACSSYRSRRGTDGPRRSHASSQYGPERKLALARLRGLPALGPNQASSPRSTQAAF